MDVVIDLVEFFRRAVVLVAADHCALRERLLEGYSAPTVPSSTSDRIVLAAVALNMVDATSLQWNEPYRTLAARETEWQRLIAILAHQAGYLYLARTVDSERQDIAVMPSEQ